MIALPQTSSGVSLLCHAFGILAAVVFLLCAAAAQAFAGVSVENVRLGVHPDKTRLVFELSARSDFRVFTLPDPWRMVVDFPELQWQAGSLPRFAGSSVRTIRQGRLEGGVSRIVVDLERPVSVRSAFLLPRAGEKPDRLVIDFLPASEKVFRAEKGKVLGSFAPAAAAFPPPPDIKPAAGPATASATAPPPFPPPRSDSREKPLVVIDPGHGGADPGAIGANRVFEKHVTLALSKALRDRLLATGRYRVRLTRETDVYLRLSERVAFARRHKADLFVSIHADSVNKPGVRGASIYTLSEKASDAQSARLAERENQSDLIAGVDLRVEDKEVASILIDLTMRETMNQSRFLANTVAGRMDSQGVRMLENPHRYAGFAVLKAPDIPSVLVEAGFMSNESEARLLSQDSHRDKIARALVAGIDAWFDKARRYDTP